MLRTCVIAACFLTVTAFNAVAQDQTIIVDQPLKACQTPTPIASATLTESQAAAVIGAALGIKTPDPQTYYIIHATEFAPGSATVAEERWYVFHTGWTARPFSKWFTDSRQARRFTEARIMGSERVSLVYLYANVPAYDVANSRDDIARHFARQRAADAPPANVEERQARLNRLRSSLSPDAEARAAKFAAQGLPPGVTPSMDPDFGLIIQLETERYLKAFGDGDKSIADEIALIDDDTGEKLVGLSPTLATTATFASLNTLFYKVAVTKKTPAPVENLKSALKLAFTGESADQMTFYVPVGNATVCAGGNMNVKHVPSDMLVTALNLNAKEEEVQRSKQSFDNEGRYWWDISFALPLDSHNDLTIDVDGGQVAAKQVEKADLFAVVNLGYPRDTKKLQWQLLPSLVYGMPITGQPLKHHLIGVSFGLNYVQVIFGRRYDQITQVSTTTQDGTPVGVESTPAQGERWEKEWVWGINIPVRSVVKLFTPDDKK